MSSELLQACLTHQASLDAISRLAVAADWDSVLNLAERHCVIPLLYRTLGNDTNIVPRKVLSRMAQTYSANAAQNLRLTSELLRLLDLFEKHRIPAVPFKGPVLADLIFGNISLRQFADLDILVREADVRRAKRLLVADGYTPEFMLEGKAEHEHIQFEHAFQFQRPQLPFVIELHWRFGSRNQAFPVDAGDAWARLEQRSFQGRTINSLCREDLVLYLAVHGAKHGWDRLEWVICLAQLLRVTTSLKWEAVAARAARTGALRILHLALSLAGEFAPLNLPETLQKEIAASCAAQQLASQIREHWFLPAPEPARRPLSRHAFYLRTRERWRDRARIVFHSSMRVPHPYARDWQVFRVPASLSFLYYLLRPIRIMSELGFRRLRHILRADTGF